MLFSLLSPEIANVTIPSKSFISLSSIDAKSALLAYVIHLPLISNSPVLQEHFPSIVGLLPPLHKAHYVVVILLHYMHPTIFIHSD